MHIPYFSAFLPSLFIRLLSKGTSFCILQYIYRLFPEPFSNFNCDRILVIEILYCKRFLRIRKYLTVTVSKHRDHRWPTSSLFFMNIRPTSTKNTAPLHYILAIRNIVHGKQFLFEFPLEVHHLLEESMWLKVLHSWWDSELVQQLTYKHLYEIDSSLNKE